MRRIISILLMAVLAPLSLSWAQNNDLSLYDQGRLERWNADQKANKGYVWTITIQSATTISCTGLIEASYALGVSMSHVGPTMYGVYRGNLYLAANRDTKGFEALLAAVGGSLKTNGDISEMSSENYLCELEKAGGNFEEVWNDLYGPDAMYSGMSGLEKSMVKDVVDGIFEDYVPREKAFERNSKPVAKGYEFQLPAGSTGALQTAQIRINNGLMSTTVSGSADIGAASSSQNIEKSWGKVRTFLGDTHYAQFNKTTDALPHTICVYPDNHVVFTLYSNDGGPVTVKFYGYIDRIPVGNTVVATGEKIKKAQSSTQLTDESVDEQKKAADVVLAARKAEAEAKEAEQKRQEEDAQRSEMAEEDKEVRALFKKELGAIYPELEGGYDMNLEIDEYDGLKYYVFSFSSDTNLVPAYKQLCRKNGFKWMNKKEEGRDMYKIVNGHYYYVRMMIDEPEYEDGRSTLYFGELDPERVKYVKEFGEK